MTDLYRGIGEDFHPRTPHLDAMIVAHAGGLSPRQSRDVLFASTDRNQAERYGSETGGLHLVLPQSGSIVRWIEGVRDMTLDFDIHMRDLIRCAAMRHDGIGFGRVLRDAAGDVSTIERYLEMGRQRRAIGAMVASFLADKTVREIHVIDWDEAAEGLDDHLGEVWISGLCVLEPTDRPGIAFG